MPKRSSKKLKTVKKPLPNDTQRGLIIMEQLQGSSTLEEKMKLVMVEMGRRGGLKGGKARAEALTPAKRKKIAQQAARARWDVKS